MNKTIQLVLTLTIALVIFYAVYKIFATLKDGVGFFKDNAEKFDPTSDKNLAYTGVNKIVQAVTGEKDVTLGTKIYDVVDSIKGWFGFSDADKQKAAEAQAKIDIAGRKATLKTVNANPSPVLDSDYLQRNPL